MLEVQNLSVSYGRHRALEGVDVAVSKGEICVILGANGAGKSTLLKTIAGMVSAEAGARIEMNGRAIAGMKPHRIVEEGIALVPEGRGIFGELTVAENLQLGAFANRARHSEAQTLELIWRLFPRLAERKRQIARTMSGGEQQMVAIGRALMSKPDILMLDEPSLGLSPILTKELFRSLKDVAATGVGILMVEQNARQSLAIADRGVLIENGLVTGEGRASDLATDPAVVNAYLGGGAKASPKPAPAASGLLPSIRIPQVMKVPLDPAAWRSAIDIVAGRAGRVQAAFVRALRRDAPVPSAFAGRYDPKAGDDPWVELEPVEPKRPAAVSDDARRVASEAAGLAERAARIQAEHVLARRRMDDDRPAAKSPEAERVAVSSKDEGRPSRAATRIVSPVDSQALAQRAARIGAAYVKALRAGAGRKPPFGWSADTEAGDRAWANLQAELGAPLPKASRSSGTGGHPSDPASLAREAGGRFAEYVAARRKAAPIPSAFTGVAPAQGKRSDGEQRTVKRGRVHGLIGHNSAGLLIEEEQGAAGAALPPAPAVRGSIPDPADLAARAAAIQAAHVAARRKSLVAFTRRAATNDQTAAEPVGGYQAGRPEDDKLKQ